MLKTAYERGIQSILVEGGAEILNAFIAPDLWDEALVLTSTSKLQRGLQAPKLNFQPLGKTSIGKDVLTQYRNHGLPDH
jgi:diaminohydroxyphosphoribosylaminopyrimidine deaminase/5-amino-6-(5-phosphoribosylamino)uracil reductase